MSGQCLDRAGRRGPSTLPSADFCAPVRSSHDSLSPVSGTGRRSPRVSLTAFTAAPPDLQPWPLMDVDFAISRPLVRPRMPRIRFLFVRSRLCSTLPPDPASRRRPCAFASTSPPSGCAEDFHLQAARHAWHTTNPLRGRQAVSALAEPTDGLRRCVVIHAEVLGNGVHGRAAFIELRCPSSNGLVDGWRSKLTEIDGQRKPSNGANSFLARPNGAHSKGTFSRTARSWSSPFSSAGRHSGIGRGRMLRGWFERLAR